MDRLEILNHKKKNSIDLKINLSTAGFTMVETLVSLAIFSLIIGSLLSLAVTQNNFFNACMGKWDVNRLARKSMNNMVKEIRMSNALNSSIWDRPIDQAGVTEDANNGRSVVFQLPVDWDGDGDFLDDYLRLEWGAEGGLDWTIEYCWDNTTEQLLRRVWDDTNTLVSQIVISNNVSSFLIKGYRYDLGLNRYVVDSAFEIVEIELTVIKRTMGGRTLTTPLTFDLSNRIFWRN